MQLGLFLNFELDEGEDLHDDITSGNVILQIFYLVYACQNHKMCTLEDFKSALSQVLATPELR
jgi:hypothetical protein